MKEREALQAYLAKKQEIRARFPEPVYHLSPSGIYHTADCASASGEILSLAEIATRNPNAKPCGRCKPPSLEREGENVA